MKRVMTLILALLSWPALAQAAFPARVTAPYVPTWNDTNLTTLSNNSGNKWWTLAFVISNGSCTPTWNGDTSLTGNNYGTYINNLRGIGGTSSSPSAAPRAPSSD